MSKRMGERSREDRDDTGAKFVVADDGLCKCFV